jgi:hypothetical protein
MRLTAIIDRLDDRINPIVVKELRQAVRSRAVVAILLVFLGLQLFFVGFNLMVSGAQDVEGKGIDWGAGRTVFVYLQALLLITLMLLVPAYACIRLASERGDHNVDLLFISTLKPHSIIAGKFFAALMLALLVFSACAPFMTFSYLLRGIDIPTIGTVLGIDLLCMAFGTMTALFLAALPGGRVVKIFACLAGFILLLILCIFMARGTTELVRFGRGFADSPVFLALAGIITGTALGWVGLMFFYAVALVSPPSSNRMMPARIYVLAAWLLTGAALWLLPRSAPMTAGPVIEFPIGLIVWMVLFSGVLALQFLVNLCERDRWGPRVARTIPRRGWLRVPAFFLYTGAAGGLALTLLMLLATLGIGLWWVRAYPLHRVREGVEITLGLILIGFLYLYCYGLSGVLVRVYLLSSQVRHGFTWVITVLLIGLGSSIPAIIAMLVFPDQVRAGSGDDWWKFPSPFLALAEAWPTNGRFTAGDFVERCYWFLGIWATVVSIGCLPWFIRQIQRFHPPLRTELPPVEPILTAEAAAVPAASEEAAPTLAAGTGNGAVATPDPAKTEPSGHATSIQPG